MSRIVLSLCDKTGVMVQPWLDAGTRPPERMHYVADVRKWHYPMLYGAPAFVFAFPPCTHLAVSGARWFAGKGLGALAEALDIVDACRRICEATGAPWMLENPVSTLATYWRKPDYTFHPWHYAGFELGDHYTKRTCLWAGNGFVMPPPFVATDAGKPDDRIHKAPPSEERADFRSATPAGFARAVFLADAKCEAA